MKVSRVYLALFSIMLFRPPDACSQEDPGNIQSSKVSSERPAQSSEKPSLRDLFFDPEDGKLDFSGFLGSARGFLPVGGLITEPAVGYGGTLGLMFLHDAIADRAEQAKARTADGHLVRVPPPSVSWLGGFATQNGSWGGGLAHLGVWKEDTYRYLGMLFYSAMDLKFYGTGGGFELPIEYLSYTLDGVYFSQQLQRRVGDTNLFLGANFKFMSIATELNLDLGFDPPGWFPDPKIDIKTSGVGVFGEYDSRNSVFTPDYGISARVEAVFYDESLGGDQTFRKASVNLRGWIPLRSSLVLGLRGDAKLSDGATPFYMLPSVDLRGISLSRYQGKNTLSTEAEIRWDVANRWSLVGFMGSGWVAEDGMSDLTLRGGKVSGGTGFRYLISRVFGIRTGMDFAWSQSDFAFYFVTGTAWGRN